MTANHSDYDHLRLISRVLTLYYIEGQNQSDVAKALGLSTAKVNRLLKQAREQGLVEITIRTPFQHLFEQEKQLQTRYQIPEAVIIPQLADEPEAVLHTVGRAAADYLLQRLRDGDTICISGGKTMNAIVQSIEPRRKYDVRVVPATGARQGKHYTDVNYLAAQLAERLGGEAYKIHAPVFVDTVEERDLLLGMRHISEVLELARGAQIALVGIGSVIPGASSYFDLMSSMAMSAADWNRIIHEEDACGEIFAYLYNRQGQLCMPDFNQRVVGLTLADLQAIPLVIGVAATPEKVLPIYGALHGHYLKTLITDEATASGALELAQAG
ncbi:MAG: sugar-binding transcriptional regulator [Anaerolineae bacterium]|nr:sugar-binding transcriptional regulator [Anaerolineae bacterium]